MARNVKERYGATPYGFYFVTHSRKNRELNAREVSRSNFYYLGGKVETLAEVEARATPNDEILISNMKNNNIARIITNNNSWRVTRPLHDTDVVLEFKP